MHKLQFISGKYDKETKNILIKATDGKKTHQLEITGFEPYFYVPSNDDIPDEARTGKFGQTQIMSIESMPLDPETGNILDPEGNNFTHENGFSVKKIIVDNPHTVSVIRNKFTQHFEADIKFLRRFLIDTGIYAGFIIKSNNINRPIHFTELIPDHLTDENKKIHYPAIISYIDFEFEISTRFPEPKNPDQPVTAWTAWDNKAKIYYTAVLSNKEEIVWKSSDWVVFYVKNEKDLFNLFNRYLLETQPHIITGWNVRIPDMEYPRARAKSIGINLRYDLADIFDLCQGYAKRHKRLYNRLKDVAVEEGIYTSSELVAEQFHKEMRYNDLEKFIAYNKMDVEILVKLDQKGWTTTDLETGKKVNKPPRHICEFFWNLKRSVGVASAEATMFNSVLMDTLMLREARKNEIILNSSGSGKGKRYSGAVVFNPPEGIYPQLARENGEVLAVVDMSRYYPNIIEGFNIDPLAVEVVKQLNKERDIYEEILDKCQPNTIEYEIAEDARNVVKYLLNTAYGYFGSPRSRKYDPEKAEKITVEAVLGLLEIREKTECIKYKLITREDGKPDVVPDLSEGYEECNKQLLTRLNHECGFQRTKGIPVRYGDTDSIVVQCKPEEIPTLVKYLNEVVLAEYCEKRGIPPMLKLKLEKIASHGLFVQAKGKEKAAKKRYAIHIIQKDGKECDFIDIAGFDYVRGDSSKITRKLQKNIIRMVLTGKLEQIGPYIRNLIKKLKANEFQFDDIAIPKTLSKKISEYTKTTPDYVKGAIWLRDIQGIEVFGGDRMKMLFTKIPANGVICYFDQEMLRYITKEENTSENLEHGVYTGKVPIVLNYDKIIDRTIKGKSIQFLKVAGITWKEITAQTTNVMEMFM